jgi:hypothetical protein
LTIAMKPKSVCSCLMAVKQHRARIVGDKVELHFLKTTQHQNILYHTGGRFAADADQLEAVPVQMRGSGSHNRPFRRLRPAGSRLFRPSPAAPHERAALA